MSSSAPTLRQSPLCDALERAGARFSSDVSEGVPAGWELPVDYGDPAREQRALREGAGLIELSHLGKIRVTGEERASFLQGMLTNDVVRLPVGAGIDSLLLNGKGRILAELLVLAYDDQILMLTDSETTLKVPEALSQFLIMEDAELTDVSSELGVLSVQGPRAVAVVGQALGHAIAFADAGAGHHALASLAASGEPATTPGRPPLTVLAYDRFATGGGVEILAAPEILAPLWDRLIGAGAVPVGTRAAEAQRIEVGRPRYGRDMDEGHFPQEAALETRMVNWEKGCYLGQETVCRIKFRGKVNNRLCGMSLDGDEVVSAGSAIALDGTPATEKPVGHLTSAALSPLSGKVVAMGYVKAAHGEPGTRLRIATPEGDRVATVVARPFLPREA